MDKKSAHLVKRATDHLFQMAHLILVSSDRVRVCDWVLQAVWRQLVAVSGPSAANAILGQALVEASSMWPLIRQLEVTAGGIDSSALQQSCHTDNCGLVEEGCKTVVSNCLGLIITLSGDELALALVDRVEAEMRGLQVELEAPHGPEQPQPEKEDHRAA